VTLPQVCVFTGPARNFGRHSQTFSPTTSTLVTASTEAVLVDTQYVRKDVDAVGDMVEDSRRTLKSILITHAHADHYLGLGELLRRFPTARPVSSPHVAADYLATREDNVALLRSMFGEQLADVDLPPELHAVDHVELDGMVLPVLALGQGDITDAATLHVPAVGALVAGDVAYNRIHPMLALCTPDQMGDWTASLDTIEALHPVTVVAGHKDPNAADDDLDTILNGTRNYIRDFVDAAAAGKSAREIIDTMTGKYPGYGNLTTLMFSAAAAVGRRP
jgi:glyoxylase-like metal-dependent hydrolase (beta-lactamase superfamily II)